jgi:hypothetical protein
MGDWCILRTTARNTLRLAETVNGAGIEAWTPSVVSKPGIPRRRARVTLREPLLPRFVFADLGRLADLLALSHTPLAGFSILRSGQGYARVRDYKLGPLRKQEDDRERARLRDIRRSQKPNPLPIGKIVPMPEGPWSGLSGAVVTSSSKTTTISLGRFNIEIETWQLPSDGVASQTQLAA